MILEAVEDDDLVEIDLPEQLAILKRVSQSCTQDTMAIRANVNKWGEYANAIHRACMEKDVGSPHISGSVPVMLTSVDDLGNKDKELDDEIELQGECVKMKRAQVEESKQQTEHYRARVQSWGHECTQADKSYKDGWASRTHSRLASANRVSRSMGGHRHYSSRNRRGCCERHKIRFRAMGHPPLSWFHSIS
ncbi:hypothetical protein SAMD00023353_2400520 [Rosellinia necatrix]|uniref:Uncharacterized protein n=1 Tax=Rosellinia necatrix TaxID=77044 RepID=A0A1S8A902_ROSNE|nr:hypothetical protein SAMD00023353_2400520 [Rosellinia necatrix]